MKISRKRGQLNHMDESKISVGVGERYRDGQTDRAAEGLELRRVIFSSVFVSINV